jgi:hypothetical protein
MPCPVVFGTNDFGAGHYLFFAPPAELVPTIRQASGDGGELHLAGRTSLCELDYLPVIPN